MTKACLSAFAALSLLCPALAHADSIQNYGFSSTMSNGTTAGGDVQFDETTGLFNGGTIYGTLAGTTNTFNFGGSSIYDTVTFANFYDAANDIFQLVIPGNKDTNYTGGNICSSTAYSGCAATSGGVYLTATSLQNGTNAYATAGTLAATPEPSSLILLGTGLLGLAGAARRRFAA